MIYKIACTILALVSLALGIVTLLRPEIIIGQGWQVFPAGRWVVVGSAFVAAAGELFYATVYPRK